MFSLDEGLLLSEGIKLRLCLEAAAVLLGVAVVVSARCGRSHLLQHCMEAPGSWVPAWVLG